MTVHSCSACGKDHPGIIEVELDTPEVIDDKEFTHHFFCPEKGIEVFVRHDVARSGLEEILSSHKENNG